MVDKKKAEMGWERDANSTDAHTPHTITPRALAARSGSWVTSVANVAMSHPLHQRYGGPSKKYLGSQPSATLTVDATIRGSNV